MSTQSGSGIESTGTTDVAQLMGEVADDNPLKPVVAALIDENRDLRERLNEAETKQAGFGKAISSNQDRIEDLEAGSNDATPTQETRESGSTDLYQPESPLEQITNLPEHVADEQLSENQKRARFIAMDVSDYADNAPKGFVVDSGIVSKVLAARDSESPHTQTVSRVMDFLDDFGQNDVEVRMHKGRRIAVFDKTAAKRFGTQQIDPSRCGVIQRRGSV